MQFAIDSLREQFEIEIWKNTFEHGTTMPIARRGSASRSPIPIRIARTTLARDLGTVVITSAQEQRLQMTKLLASRVSEVHDSAADAARRPRARGVREGARDRRGAAATASSRSRRRSTSSSRSSRTSEASAEKTISEIATSRDALADRITAAGLDLTVTVVDERRGQLAPSTATSSWR